MLVIHNINQPVSPCVVQALFFTIMKEILENFTYKGRIGRDFLDEKDIGKIFCADNPEKSTPRAYYLIVSEFPQKGEHQMLVLNLTDVYDIKRNEYIEMCMADLKTALEVMQQNKAILIHEGVLFTHKYYGTFYFYEPKPISNTRRIGKYKIMRKW